MEDKLIRLVLTSKDYNSLIDFLESLKAELLLLELDFDDVSYQVEVISELINALMDGSNEITEA